MYPFLYFIFYFFGHRRWGAGGRAYALDFQHAVAQRKVDAPAGLARPAVHPSRHVTLFTPLYLQNRCPDRCQILHTHSSDGISQLTFSYGPHLAPLFDIYKKYIIKLKTHKQSISKGKVLFHTYIPFPHPKPRSLSLGLDGPLRCKRLLLFCHAWLSERVQGILLT